MKLFVVAALLCLAVADDPEPVNKRSRTVVLQRQRDAVQPQDQLQARPLAQSSDDDGSTVRATFGRAQRRGSRFTFQRRGRAGSRFRGRQQPLPVSDDDQHQFSSDDGHQSFSERRPVQSHRGDRVISRARSPASQNDDDSAPVVLRPVNDFTSHNGEFILVSDDDDNHGEVFLVEEPAHFVESGVQEPARPSVVRGPQSQPRRKEESRRQQTRGHFSRFSFTGDDNNGFTQFSGDGSGFTPFSGANRRFVSQPRTDQFSSDDDNSGRFVSQPRTDQFSSDDDNSGSFISQPRTRQFQRQRAPANRFSLTTDDDDHSVPFVRRPEEQRPTQPFPRRRTSSFVSSRVQKPSSLDDDDDSSSRFVRPRAPRPQPARRPPQPRQPQAPRPVGRGFSRPTSQPARSQRRPSSTTPVFRPRPAPKVQLKSAPIFRNNPRFSSGPVKKVTHFDDDDDDRRSHGHNQRSSASSRTVIHHPGHGESFSTFSF